MDPPHTHLHFVLLPLVAQGHLIPMIDIARILARRGATVTIITTPLNASRFKPVVARAIEAKLKIQVVELQLSLAEVGLPIGCESFDMLPTAELMFKLITAMDMLEGPVEELLRGLCPGWDCIVSDSLFHWTTDVARRFGVPRIVFHGPGCFWLLSMQVVFTTNLFDGIESDSERFVLPGLPDRVEVTKPQALGWTKANTTELKNLQQKIQDAEKDAHGIVVNSFQELEPEYVKELAKAKDKKVWCIGPVSLCNESSQDVFERGNKAAIDKHDCLEWLESREPRSVVYVCLGSLASDCTGQAIELGLGLESMNRPFIWCIRNTTEELETWFSKDGFKERVKERGLIVHGWAPQVLILSHQATGCFLTHCGWNSTLEAVCAGVPMVTWPHMADQFLNEKFIIEVLKIGVRIGVEVLVVYGEEDKIGVLVEKEDVKTAIECLMDEGKEGKERKERAREFAEMAKRAMEEGGSSHLNLTLLIHDITKNKTDSLNASFTYL